MDLSTLEDLRQACSAAEKKQQNDEWSGRLRAFLEMVALADLEERSSLEFHNALWEENPVSATGQGTIDVSGLTSRKDFRRWFAERSLAINETDPEARIKKIDDFCEDIKGRMAKYCRATPRLKIYRALAALFPRDFTTIAYQGALRRLARAMFGRASHDIVRLHRRILDRFAEALGPAGSDQDSWVQRMTLPWKVYAEAVERETDGTSELDPDEPGEEKLVPLPAARRRRGLTSIKGSFQSMLSILEFVQDGVTRDQVIDFLRASSPTVKDNTLGMVINVLQSEFAVIRLVNDRYQLTDRGRGVLESGDPDDLQDWLLTRILGFDHALLALDQEEAVPRSDMYGLLKKVNPGWTSNFAPTSMLNWMRQIGVADATDAGFTITDRGREWAALIDWTPECLSPELEEDEIDDHDDVQDEETSADTPFQVPDLPTVIKSMANENVVFTDSVVSDLHAGLWSNERRHFAILTGLSGSGKTQLARRYGLALNANEKAIRHVEVIPVEPGWHDPSPLLGYVNPLARQGEEKYVRTDFLNFLLRAAADPARPYTVILDEMNLSHPEQYLAPILSAMETGDAIKLHREKAFYDGVPERIPYPANLVLIGTVNMDETTLGLSDKILDRAFVVEFWTIDLSAYPRWGKRSLKSETERSARVLLEELMAALEPARLHFGWRVVDEVLDFLLQTRTGQQSVASALDSVIYAKVLPKLRGDDSPRFRNALGTTLEVLKKHELPRCHAKALQLRDDLETSGSARFWR